MPPSHATKRCNKSQMLHLVIDDKRIIAVTFCIDKNSHFIEETHFDA